MLYGLFWFLVFASEIPYVVEVWHNISNLRRRSFAASHQEVDLAVDAKIGQRHHHAVAVGGVTVVGLFVGVGECGTFVGEVPEIARRLVVVAGTPAVNAYATKAKIDFFAVFGSVAHAVASLDYLHIDIAFIVNLIVRCIAACLEYGVGWDCTNHFLASKKSVDRLVFVVKEFCVTLAIVAR